MGYNTWGDEGMRVWGSSPNKGDVKNPSLILWCYYSHFRAAKSSDLKRSPSPNPLLHTHFLSMSLSFCLRRAFWIVTDCLGRYCFVRLANLLTGIIQLWLWPTQPFSEWRALSICPRLDSVSIDFCILCVFECGGLETAEWVNEWSKKLLSCIRWHFCRSTKR